MTLKSDVKFEEKLTGCLENDMRNLANFHQSTRKCQNWNFDGILLPKVEYVWLWNLQWSYVSWHWRMIQKLKRNWLGVLKLLWGTSQILTAAHGSLKNICFNWLLEIKVYILFELQKYRGVVFHDTEEMCKFWQKTDLWFEKKLEKFGRFSPQHLKVSKLGLWWDPFAPSRKGMTLKFAG